MSGFCVSFSSGGGGGADAGSGGGSATDGGTTDGGATDGGTTDGGTTDGGASDGGASDGGACGPGVCGGCRQVQGFPGVQTVALYSSSSDSTVAQRFSGTADPYDILILAVRHNGGGLSFPYTRTFSSSTTSASCNVCLVYSEDCSPSSSCTRNYLARAGSITVGAASRNEDAGVLNAGATGLRFAEWNFNSDAPVASGRCIEIAGQVSFNEVWP